MNLIDYFRHVHPHHQNHHLQNHNRLISIVHYYFLQITDLIFKHFITRDISYYNIAEKIISFVDPLLSHTIHDSNTIKVTAKIINLFVFVIDSLDAFTIIFEFEKYY